MSNESSVFEITLLEVVVVLVVVLVVELVDEVCIES